MFLKALLRRKYISTIPPQNYALAYRCTKGVLLLMILNVLLPEEKEKVVNANGQQSWLVFQLHLRAQILNSWSFKVVKTGSSSEFAQICSAVSEEQDAVKIFSLMLMQYNEELWPISEADYHLRREWCKTRCEEWSSGNHREGEVILGSTASFHC